MVDTLPRQTTKRFNSMNTILVSYDLRAPGKDYARLWEHLQSYQDYIKPLESFWLLRTSYSAEQVRNTVKQYIDANDRLIVINVTSDAAAWFNLSDKHSQWIKDNL